MPSEPRKTPWTPWTPGPWRLDDPEHADLLSDDYHIVDAGDGFYGSDGQNGFSLSSFMTPANARLIAAAPSLADALRKAVEAMEIARGVLYAVGYLEIGEQLASDTEDARAALAEIEGGEG